MLAYSGIGSDNVRMNRLSDVINRPQPTMAVTFTEAMSETEIAAIVRVADVAELRADTFPSHDPAYLIEQAQRLAPLPVLATIRSANEGGQWHGTEAERVDLFTALMPHVRGVDVELETQILPDIVKIAHGAGRLVVASSHDFEAMPSFTDMEARLEQAMKANANYLKIAASANTAADFDKLVAFTRTHKRHPIITVAMDGYGPLSRITLPALGSRMTYAAASAKPAAPGQMSYQETRQLLDRFIPLS